MFALNVLLRFALHFSLGLAALGLYLKLLFLIICLSRSVGFMDLELRVYILRTLIIAVIYFLLLSTNRAADLAFKLLLIATV